MTIATTTLASIGNVKAQSGDTEQVKEYLNQALQALDDDNNTLALEQVDLASDVLENMTGGADAGEEEDDNNGTTEKVQERTPLNQVMRTRTMRKIRNPNNRLYSNT